MATHPNIKTVCLQCEKRRKVLVINPERSIQYGQDKFNSSAEKCYFDSFKAKERERKAPENSILPAFTIIYEWVRRLFASPFVEFQSKQNCINCRKKSVLLRNDFYSKKSDYILHIRETIFLIYSYANRCKNPQFHRKPRRTYGNLLNKRKPDLSKPGTGQLVKTQRHTETSHSFEIGKKFESQKRIGQLFDCNSSKHFSKQIFCSVSYLKHAKFFCKLKEFKNNQSADIEGKSNWCQDKSKGHCFFFKHLFINMKCPNKNIFAQRTIRNPFEVTTDKNFGLHNVESRKPLQGFKWFRILDNGTNSFFSQSIFRLHCRSKSNLPKAEPCRSTIILNKQVQKGMEFSRFFERLENNNVCKVKLPQEYPLCKVVAEDFIITAEFQGRSTRPNATSVKIFPHNVSTVCFDMKSIVFFRKCPVQLSLKIVNKTDSETRREINGDGFENSRISTKLEESSANKDLLPILSTETEKVASEVDENNLMSTIGAENLNYGSEETIELHKSQPQEGSVQMSKSNAPKISLAMEMFKGSIEERMPTKTEQLKLPASAYSEDKVKTANSVLSFEKQNFEDVTQEILSPFTTEVQADQGSETSSFQKIDPASLNQPDIPMTTSEAPMLKNVDNEYSEQFKGMEPGLDNETSKESSYYKDQKPLLVGNEQPLEAKVLSRSSQATQSISSSNSSLGDFVKRETTKEWLANDSGGSLGTEVELNEELEPTVSTEAIDEQQKMRKGSASLDKQPYDIWRNVVSSASSEKYQVIDVPPTKGEGSETIGLEKEVSDLEKALPVEDCKVEKILEHTKPSTVPANSGDELLSIPEGPLSKVAAEMSSGNTLGNEVLLTRRIEDDKKVAETGRPYLTFKEPSEAPENSNAHLVSLEALEVHVEKAEEIRSKEDDGLRKMGESHSDLELSSGDIVEKDVVAKLSVSDTFQSSTRSVVFEESNEKREREDTAVLHASSNVARQKDDENIKMVSSEETSAREYVKTVNYDRESNIDHIPLQKEFVFFGSGNDQQVLGNSGDRLTSSEIVIAPLEPTKSVMFATESIIKTTEVMKSSSGIKCTAVTTEKSVLATKQSEDATMMSSNTAVKKTVQGRTVQEAPIFIPERNITSTKVVTDENKSEVITAVSAVKVIDYEADDLPGHTQRKTASLQGGQISKIYRDEEVSFEKDQNKRRDGHVSDDKFPGYYQEIGELMTPPSAKEEDGKFHNYL